MNGIQLNKVERSKVIRALLQYCLTVSPKPGQEGILNEMAKKLVARYPIMASNTTEDSSVRFKKYFLTLNKQKGVRDSLSWRLRNTRYLEKKKSQMTEGTEGKQNISHLKREFDLKDPIAESSFVESLPKKARLDEADPDYLSEEKSEKSEDSMNEVILSMREETQLIGSELSPRIFFKY